MYRANVIIHLCYDNKKNRSYMIDTTTKKVYSHHQTVNFNSNWAAVVSVVIIFVILPGFANWFESLGMNDLSGSVKILLALIGIFIAGIVFLLINMKKSRFLLEDYLMKYPQAKEENDISDILDRISNRVMVVILVSLTLLFTGVVLFLRYVDSSNFITFLWALVVFALFAAVTSFIKDIIFIRKFKRNYTAHAVSTQIIQNIVVDGNMSNFVEDSVGTKENNEKIANSIDWARLSK